LTELEKRSGALRTWGDCYGHVLVATGRAQAMVDPYMYAWDIVPIQAVVEEAGGICPGWRSPRDDRFFAGISATPKTYTELEHLVETHLRR
jgi:fructose-1,6-bisphosphatase/inositol monophosphatase family enzyme